MNSNTIPLPPAELQLWAGGGEGKEYLRIGKELSEDIIRLTGARKDMKILEPGCGAGRVARFFVDFLDEDSGGEFYGFDVHSPSIDWATRNITAYAGHFQFHCFDIYNDMYNPGFKNPYSTKSHNNWQANVDVWESADPNLGGKRKTVSEEIHFPYEDNYFDLSYTASLFTHLTKPYLEKYIDELFRVSRTGAKVYSTFFCLGEGGLEAFIADCVERGLPDSYYIFDDVSYTQIKTMPSAMMIFEQQYLKSMITKAGFTIISSGSGFQAPWVFEKKTT